MTLKHSPGPWKFHRDGWYIEDSDGNAIAEVNSAHPGDGQIFAAAPDMLRLLRILSRPMTRKPLAIQAAMFEACDIIEKLDGDTCPGT